MPIPIAVVPAVDFARKHWKLIASGIAVLVLGFYIMSLKADIAVAQRDAANTRTTLADERTAAATAARLVAEQNTRNLAALTQFQAQQLDATRAAIAAADAKSQTHRDRIAASVKADPKADQPVGAVLGSIFED